MAVRRNETVGTPKIEMAQASVTRPNDTTAYAAGDGIADATTTATSAGYFSLDFGHRQGGGLTLLDFTLHKSTHNVTLATFWLLLFDTVPALTGFDDNAQLAITDAEMLTCQGAIIFPAASWVNVVLGDIQTVSQSVAFVPTSSAKIVYGILVAGDGYTPTAQEVFSVTAHAIID